MDWNVTTKQEALDRVAQQLAKGTVAKYIYLACDGTKCAVGLCLTDEALEKISSKKAAFLFGGHAPTCADISDLIQKGVLEPPPAELTLDFVRDLQNANDVVGAQAFSFKKLAEDRGLTFELPAKEGA